MCFIFISSIAYKTHLLADQLYCRLHFRMINDDESEISALALLFLNGDEQTLEISSSKALVVPPLDDLIEKSRPVLNGLGEDLQQIAMLVVIKQNLVLLKSVNVLSHLDGHVRQVLADVVIVGIWDGEELHASFSERAHCFNDGFRVERDMLCPSTVIVIDVFLDLRLLLALGRLVDGHLDVLIVVSHHNRPERRVLGVHDAVVDRPEAVEVESLLVVLHRGLHHQVRLVAHYVIDLLEADRLKKLVKALCEMMGGVTRHEGALVVFALHERVNRISIGFDGRQNNNSVLVRELVWSTHRHTAVLDGVVVYRPRILDTQGDVLDTVTVLNEVAVHFLGRVPMVGRAEDESGALVVTDYVADHRPVTGLQSLVGEVLKTEAGSVVGCGLLSVSHPKEDVVSDRDICTEGVDLSESGRLCLVLHLLSNYKLRVTMAKYKLAQKSIILPSYSLHQYSKSVSCLQARNNYLFPGLSAITYT